MKLLVYWGTDDEADLQIPKAVKWEDGTSATLDDYYKNQCATQTSESTDKGMVTVIFPDVVATVRFDVAKSHWLLQALSGGPIDLEQTDPNASDETLKWEISCYPVVYRTTFDRSHLASDTAVEASIAVCESPVL